MTEGKPEPASRSATHGEPGGAASGACRSGVLAFGDSITNGGGELQWGVALQSWAQWVARGLGMPFTSYAVDGNRAVDVVSTQIPAFLARNARADSHYDVGCLYIGVNDVRAVDWDPSAFDLEFRRAMGFLLRRCDRVLTATAPLDLGRPRAGAKVEEMNRLVEAAASGAGALVVDLRYFAARNLIMADHVHPTAFGQIAIAERALAVLERDGMTVQVRPGELIEYEVTSWRRLRSDLTYAYRHAKVSARAGALGLLARLR
ncbi:MAG: GDSL-type esterase/lipase family protein [Solirubrobacteraceae bacterium]